MLKPYYDGYLSINEFIVYEKDETRNKELIIGIFHRPSSVQCQ